EGIEQLEALAALEPSQPQRMVDVGLAYARLGRTDAAITALGHAAERYPEADGVYIALGQVWLESAEAHNDRVARSHSLEAPQAKHLSLVVDHATGPGLLALRADVQFRLGQVEAARASLAEGLAIDQRNIALLQLRRKIG